MVFSATSHAEVLWPLVLWWCRDLIWQPRLSSLLCQTSCCSRSDSRSKHHAKAYNVCYGRVV
jgi:hypothetical protein